MKEQRAADDDPICLFIHEDELRLNTTEGLLILIDQRLREALDKIDKKDARKGIKVSLKRWS